MLHIKIDKCLTPLLAYKGLEKSFSYKADEEEDVAEDDSSEAEEEVKAATASNKSD